MNMIELAHTLTGMVPQDRLDGMARVVAGWRKAEMPKSCKRCDGYGHCPPPPHIDPMTAEWATCPDCSGLGSRMVAY